MRWRGVRGLTLAVTDSGIRGPPRSTGVPRLRASWERPQVGAGERTVATHLTLEPEDNPPWLLAIVLDSRCSELVMTVPSRDRQRWHKLGVGAWLTLPLPRHETPRLSPGLGGFASLGHSLGLLPFLLHHLNHSTQPWIYHFQVWQEDIKIK